MKKDTLARCADAGGKYCPCHLAYSGDCIQCPVIRGSDTCNCMWQGVCIYNELSKGKYVPRNNRVETICKIENVKNLGDDTYIVKIKVPETLINDLLTPGAYILLKNIDKESDVFNAPISVMDVDEKQSMLEVVIKQRGIKTKGIATSKEIKLKGVYFNGVFGLKQIKTSNNSNSVVILNGLSQVNSLNVIRRLLHNKNKVDVFIDENAIILEEIIDKINKLNVNIYTLDLKKDRNYVLDYIKRNNVELVYSAGSNRFSNYVRKIVDEVDENIKFVISNNNLICCGEGICGACTVRVNNEKIKTCKAQVDARDFLKSQIL